MIAPFIRPPPDIGDDEVFETHVAQEKRPLRQLHELLPNEITVGISGGPAWEATKHANSLFIGVHDRGGKHGLERYLVKVFSGVEQQIMAARREVLFSYLYTECGEALTAPKISMFKLDDYYVLLRRFYRGRDGRFLLENPSQLPPVSSAALTKNFAMRHVLFGDMDLNNPGNVIFTNVSRLTPKTILNIDGEDIMPDEGNMAHFLDSHWSPGEPLPGSVAWREKILNALGGDEFFRRQMSSENSMLAFLRILQNDDIDSAAAVTLDSAVVERCLAARPYIESLVKSFGVAPVEELYAGQTNFQQVLDIWAQRLAARPDVPISLRELTTGEYRFISN